MLLSLKLLRDKETHHTVTQINPKIVGIVVGSVLLLTGVGVIIMIVILKRKRKRKLKPEIQKNQISNVEKEQILVEISKTRASIRHSQIHFNEIVIEKEIGEGSYGKVFCGKWNDAPVALKFCRNKGTLINFVSEIKVMLELPPHPNIVQLFGVSLDGPQPVIVMEYCAGGSLDKLLFDRHDEQGISNERKMELIQGIARGIFHLHKHNIVHRDLATRNILLSGNGDPKISDFGLSRILEKSEEGKTKNEFGPVRWMAPESIATRNYSKKSDVWMFGIVVYEIVAQCEPHKEIVNVLEVATAIRDQGLTPKIPDDCPPLLRQVMEMCWQKDPEQRPVSFLICISH
jgi:serine/threonine protein kinase